ncbi:MAG TPA: hypothetical protein VGH28_24515 [Polyangiaceae bacterium]
MNRLRLVGWQRRVLAIFLTLLTLRITAYFFAILNDGFLHAGLNYDESYFAWCGWMIDKGYAPYRDFLEFKPPMTFITHALALKLFGFQHFEYRKFFAYFPLGSLLAVQLAMLSRRIDRWLALALTLAFIQIWVNPSFHDVALSDSESIGLTYYLFAIAFLLARTRLGPALQWIGGAFFACCILSKEPFLPCVGMSWISLFLIGDEPGTLGVRARRYAGRTIGGGLVVLGILCLYMIPSGALRAYLDVLHRYFHFYRDVKESYCVVLGRFHPTKPFNDLHMQWRAARQAFANSTLLGFLAPFGVASTIFIFKRSRVLFVSVLIGLASALWAVTASNCQWAHYYTMTMSGLFFALVVGLDSMTPHFRAMSRASRAFVSAALLAGVLMHVWVRFDAERDKYGTRVGQDFDSQEPIPGVFEAVKQYTSPSDYIVTTGAPSLYMQVDRINGMRESTTDDEVLGFYSGDTDKQKLSVVRAELLRTRPKLIILDSNPSGDGRKRRWRAALWDPFISELHYREVKPRIYLRPD